MNIIGDIIVELKKIEELSQDIVFSDPPYNLGSKWITDPITGKPEVKGRAVDFMNNKWKGLTGSDLESMFNDFYRILKHGGYVVFAGQMRQAMAFQYYAINSGFDMIEPIYSYSISNFPKALDVSKSLDKHFGEEREKVATGKTMLNIKSGNSGHTEGRERIEEHEDTPSSDLAKKYNGIKSSICPLKQTTEVWFIFRKPFKHKTIIGDILRYEENQKIINQIESELKEQYGLENIEWE